jgi:hypothetical protein
MPIRFQQRPGKPSKPSPQARCVYGPSKWGNPFKMKEYGRQGAADMYRATLFGDQAEARRILHHDLFEVRSELTGRDLGCYCRLDQPCHADTLLEVANGVLADIA